MLENSHVQTTATLWPNNSQLKEQLSLPLALSLQPFAHQHLKSQTPSQKINQLRCQSCKAFLNQLCFIRSENEYDCSICGCTNHMFEPIDIRMVELNNLSYKIKAPQTQRLLKSTQRLLIIVLDLSDYGAQSKSYLLNALQVIKQQVNNASELNLPLSLMLIGFDAGIHRFIINPSGNGKPQRILSCGNEQDGDDQYFCDFKEQIGNIKDCKQHIQLLLEVLQQQIITEQLRTCSSMGIMDAIRYAFRASQTYSGKIMLVSGLRHQLQQFNQKMKKYAYDVVQQHNFVINKKECIKGAIETAIQSTQMSLCISFINTSHINNTPFHCITKLTNGQLRHYFPNQIQLFYHQFKQSIQTILQQSTVYQSLLRVRYSTGLKLAGIFGAFRPTKIIDQIQLLTCPQNRQYLFQFIIQGKITSSFVVIQFSSLFTDLKGDRYFVIETHLNKVSSDIKQILPSIDYTNVMISYVRGVIHNLDTTSNLRSLQVALQERCKKHLTIIRKNSETQPLHNQSQLQVQPLSKIKPYVVITFLMMKHFLLNLNYKNIFHFDLNAEIRSKVATLEKSINIIWPLVYAVNDDGWELIEMRQKYLSKGTVALFIDRCDQHYVYLINPRFEAILKTADAKAKLYDLIQNQQALIPLKKLIEQLKQSKGTQFIDILPIQDLRELKILDLDGQFGFDKFLNELMSV